MRLRLYGYWRSTSTWRVRIALAWKGIAHDVVPIDLRGGDRPERRPPGPMGKVPVLEVLSDGGDGSDGRGVAIAESMSIIHWLEHRFPDPPLIPRDPLLAARARTIAEMVNSGIQPFHNLETLQHVKHVMGGDDRAWAAHWIETGLAALERAAADTAGAFAVGDAPTLADVYLVPQLDAARRFSVDPAPYPTLLRIEQACAPLPAFVAALPSNQPDAPGRGPAGRAD